MSGGEWLLLFVVLTVAYTAGQGLSILLFRSVMQRRKAPKVPDETLMRQIAYDAVTKAQREMATAAGSSAEVRPRRQATWASGVRSDRNRRREGGREPQEDEE